PAIILRIMDNLPEPWLRGPIPGLNPLLSPILYSFQQAREDLARYTQGLTPEQLWSQPFGFASVGFHLRHIAGSTDRLITYLQALPPTAPHLAPLHAEDDPGPESRDDLLDKMNCTFLRTEDVVRSIAPATLAEVRTVGRKQLPTTVAGLLTHI